MGKLINRFSWSPSRDRLYRTCARAYYLNYYGSWGGWERGAPESARLAYRLKQMTDLPMFAGTVVHDVIKGAIARIRGGQQVDRDYLLSQASNQMNRGWRDSRGEAWRRIGPKRATTLFEHHYVERLSGESVPEAAIRATKSKVEACLDHYLETEVHAALVESGGEDVRSYEELTQFEVEGTTVWLAIDLARDTGSGIEIYDWKTGRANEADSRQLCVYGLYASEVWGASADRIRVHAVYLREGESSVESLNEDILAATRSEISTSAEGLRALLADPENNIARESDFAMAEETESCRGCRFQEICHPQGVPGGPRAGYTSTRPASPPPSPG
ncbi:MAG: hypothetical protein CMJ48_13545 [Planctomycetaceae bacterium]|nr:hypothetical protein [Planctomycetaceae bacterium]